MAKKNYREIYNSINAVEGFDPAKVVEQNEEGDSVLRIRDRLAWFKLKCPNGRIETELHSFNGNIAIVKASIFTEPNDSTPVATGYGTALFSDKDAFGLKPVECAETYAIGRALSNAGYGIQFAGNAYEVPDDNDAGFLKTPKPEKNDITNIDDVVDDSVEKTEEKIQSKMKQISPTMSKSIILSYGPHVGKSISDLYKEEKNKDKLFSIKKYAFPENVVDAPIMDTAACRVFCAEIEKTL